MKICPNCKMTVDADAECPICQATLTYESTVEATSEKYKLNKYLLLYLLRHCWFSILCIISVALKMIISKPRLDSIFLLIVALCVLSLLVSIFENKISKLITIKYSESYARIVVYTMKLLLGIVALILALVLWR